MINILTNKKHLSTGVFTAGRLTCTFLHMLNGILVVRLLEPSVLGFFNRDTVVLGYLLWFTMGVFSGLTRELPYYYGKKDFTTVHSLAAAANAFAIILGGLGILLFSAMAIKYALQKQYWHSIVWLANSIVSFETFYKAYLSVTYRTKHDFVKLALIDVSVASLSLASLVIVWQWHFYGLCIRAALLSITSLAVMYRFRPIRVAPRWDYGKLLHLFKTGLPIYMTGYVVSWWGVTLSTTWIAWKYDAFQMGLYTLPAFIFGTVTLFSNSIKQVYFPRLVEAYAKSGNVREIFGILVKPTLLLLVVNLIILAAGWIVLPHAIRLLAPKYVNAILPSQLILLNCLIYWLSPFLEVFYVLRKPGLYFCCIVVGILINLYLLFYLDNKLEGITNVIVANFISRGCYMVLSIAVLWFVVIRSATVEQK